MLGKGLSLLSNSKVRFALVSALSFIVLMSSTWTLHEIIGVSQELAYLSALFLATIMNFLSLRYFVYPGSETGLFTQFSYFLSAVCGFRVAEYLSFSAIQALTDIQYMATIFMISIVSLISKFLFFRGAVFK